MEEKELKIRLYLEICSACNLKCKYCFEKDYIPQFMDTDKLFNFANIIKPLVDDIVITGGEPTLHPDFFKIVEHFPEYTSIVITTNGSFLNINKIKELLAHHSNVKVQFSLDAIDHNFVDFVRGEGIYSKILNALYDLKEFSSQLSISSTLTLQTPEMIEAIYAFNIIEVCGRNASIQLIDGIILEQSIIDSIVAKYNGLFWQCILYNNKNTLCIEFRIFGDTSIDCELILKELTNSLDFEDLVSQKKVLLSCKSTSRIVGNTRKAIRYLDARNYSETISFELLKANCFEAYYYSLPRLTSSNIEKVISTYNLIDTNKLVDIGIFITHFWNERTWKLCPRIFHYCYNRNSKLLLKKCLEMAVNSDWEVREEAAKVIAIIVMNEFDRIDNWLNQCITSNNENIRRAILLSLKYCVEYDSDYSRREKLLSYMDLFLFDTSTYVKKSFDSFTIGDGFLNVCPELVEIKFDYWCTLNNERVACSVIRAFKSSGGVKSWPLAKKYLDYYRSANSSSIQKALTATSNYLKKRINLEDY